MMSIKDSLRRSWELWKRVGRKIGDFQSRLILSLFYFVILFPFALVVRLKADPLGIKKGAARGWHQRAEDGSQPLDKASRQF
jgi:hypothetical protein